MVGSTIGKKLIELRYSVKWVVAAETMKRHRHGSHPPQGDVSLEAIKMAGLENV